MQSILRRTETIHEAIIDILCKIMNDHDANAVFSHVCNILVDRQIYSAVSIGISDKNAVNVKTIAQAGLQSFNAELQLPDLPEIQRDGYFVCNNLSLNQNGGQWSSEAAKRGFQSMASFPIKIGNSIVAVLALYSFDKDTFTSEELSSIETLRRIISDALVRMRLDEHKKHAQMELQRREAIYSRVAEKMVGMLCEINRERIFTFVGDSQKRVLGYEPDELLGKALADFIHADCLEAFDNTLRKADQSYSTEAAEVRVKKPNGQYAWMELIADGLVDDDGGISGFVIALRDVTERKEMTQKLERYVHELEERVKERTQRIRSLDESARQRVMRAINQINNISELRDRLKREPGFESGFELIVRRAIRDLTMDTGGVFVLNPITRKIETKAFAPCKRSTVQTSYSLDEAFVEFETFSKKETLSRSVGEGRSILGTETIHCAPISTNGQVRGFLALGANGARVLDESDLSIVKLYSALVTTLLKSTDLNVEPARELIRPLHQQCRVEFGNSYLVPDNVALAYELFHEAIMSGTEGLCITRTAPARIREKYKLQRTPVIWLTDEVVDGEKSIHSLQDLSILVSNYVQKASKPVILVDGVEYLISHKGFESVYHLMQAKRTQMEANEGILIIPFFRDAIETKEAKLLEREFLVFGASSDIPTATGGIVPTRVQPNDFY